jgi:hypothetical protein
MSQENVDIVRRAWEAATSKPPNWSVLDLSTARTTSS